MVGVENNAQIFPWEFFCGILDGMDVEGGSQVVTKVALECWFGGMVESFVERIFVDVVQWDGTGGTMEDVVGF